MSQTGPWSAAPHPTFPPPQAGLTPVAPPVPSAWAQPRPTWQPVVAPTWPGYPQAPAYPPPAGNVPPGAYPQPGPTYAGYPTATPVQPGYAPYPPAGPWVTPTPFPRPVPVRKKSALARVVIFVALFVVAAPVISSIVSNLNQPMYPTYPAPTHTARPTATATLPTQTGTAGTYTPGAPDLNPDDPPMPESYDEVNQALDDNPLYAQHLVPTQCTITTIDLVNAPVAQIEQHMNQFVDCLMAAWYPPVTGAGFELPHPSVTVYTSQINTPCGQLPMENAVYCSADQQIYYAQDLIQAFPTNLQTMRFLAESIIAHEFGHTIQYRTMILMSESVLESDATTDDDQLDLSRRLEMQADCFAGVFLNSVSASADLSSADEANIVKLFTSLGGTTPYSDDHGTGTNRAYWAEQGLKSTTPGVCSTFTASASRVS